MAALEDPTELALFPVQAVLFPGGLLSLKVFESRYVDLMASCLRESRFFGIVTLRGMAPSAAQVGDASPDVEPTGVVAELMSADSVQPGVLQVRCRGLQRFSMTGSRRHADGLWLADAHLLPDDTIVAPSADMHGTVRGLANAIAALRGQGSMPFLQPYQFDQAGWVANRWCEILPISLAAKQKLMELADPAVRLQLVDEFLRSKGVV